MAPEIFRKSLRETWVALTKKQIVRNMVLSPTPFQYALSPYKLASKNLFLPQKMTCKTPSVGPIHLQGKGYRGSK